jgi:hypothetical protein
MKEYTHRDSTGMLWRFEGSRPISQLADQVMQEVEEKMKKEEAKKKGKKK